MLSFGIFLLVHNIFAQNTAEIQCLSVRESGDVDILWQAPDNTTNFAAYQIYFRHDWLSTYNLLTEITDPTIINFAHIGASANTAPVAYYVQTKYSSGEEYLSDTVQSIFLEAINLNDVQVQLNWNKMHEPELASTSGVYDLFVEYPPGIWEFIASTAETTYTHDISVCVDSLNYKVSLSNTLCSSESNIGGKNLEDLRAPDAPIFDSVSINEEGMCILGWDKASALDLSGYFVFQQIGGIWDTLATLPNADSLFLKDTLSKACEQIYTYSVASYDRCRNTTPDFGLEQYQKSILLDDPQIFICDSTIQLSWSEYINLRGGIKNYQILCSDNDGPQELIQTNSPDIRFFDYKELERDHVYCFQIRAINSDGNYTASSCKKCIKASLPPQPDYVLLPKVSVRENVWADLSAWVDSTIDIKNYILFRKEGDGEFKNYDTIPSGDIGTNGSIHYSDGIADVTKRSYSYYLQAIDSCENNTIEGTIAQSMYLSAEPMAAEGWVQLQWNAYVGFEDANRSYEVYRAINGVWEESPISIQNDTEFTDQTEEAANLENKIKYRIACVGIALPFLQSDTSWSNIVEVQQKFTGVYIPNAFTPRREINNIFIPRYAAIDPEFYVFIIFNRFGQAIFETDDPYQGWDGTHNGEAVSSNLYVYYLKMRTPEGDFVERRGKVMLLD